MEAVTSPNELVALEMPGGRAFVDALRRVWDRGDAVFPLDLRLPARRARRCSSDGRRRRRRRDGDEQRPPRRSPVEPATRSSSPRAARPASPKGVVLTHAAVEASARATRRASA